MLKAARALRTLLAQRRAAAALEFAIVSLPLFLLSFAAIELGLILWTQSALQGVAADAARCGAINGSACTGSNTIPSFVQTEAANWVMGSLLASTGSPLTVNVNANATCPQMTVGSYETVQIITAFFASGWMPPPFNSYQISVCASFAN